MVSSKVKTERTWGCWYLDTTLPMSLNIDLPWYVYDIELSRCGTEHVRQIWVDHMAQKRFISGRDIGDLRRAFDNLIAAGLLPGKDEG